jgi:hypothetical protein
MASGFLGKAIPAAGVWSNIYTVPTGKVASFSVNACNLGTSTGVDLVVSTSASYLTIAQSEYIEFASQLPTTGATLERTGLMGDATNGKYVWVRSGSGNVAFQVYGYEE